MQETMSRFQPMNLGDILNTTFNMYRDNFTLFAGICAVIVVPQAILVSAFSASHNALFGLLGGLLSIAVSFLLTGALAQAVSARYLGRPMTISQAYEALGTVTILTLVGVAFLSAILILIGFIVFIIPGIYIAVRFTLASQAAVLERRSVTDSLRRSWNLVEGNWWRVLGIIAAVDLLVGVLEIIAGRLVGAVAGNVLGTGLSILVVGILIQPIQASALTLLYYDLRIRKEGGAAAVSTEPSSRWGV
jgi:hypothetical protein